MPGCRARLRGSFAHHQQRLGGTRLCTGRADGPDGVQDSSRLSATSRVGGFGAIAREQPEVAATGGECECSRDR